MSANERLAVREGPRWILFCCGIIVCLAFIAFFPSLNNGFTNWDDNAYVTDNPDIRSITYCLKGDFDRGIADLTQTTSLDPKNGEAFYNRGLAYEMKNDIARARRTRIRHSEQEQSEQTVNKAA